MSRRGAIAVVIALAALSGCEDRPVPDPDPVAPAPVPPAPSIGTRPSMKSLATAPATTQSAAESLINIDGNLVLFPAAKMRIDSSDGKTVVRLFSDDPKGAALDANYDGNSFYLQIELDPEDAKALDGVQLTYRAPSSERDDSPYGIFLEGRRWVLQPADVRVTFEGSSSPLDVQVSGTFLMFDSNDETAKPHHVKVHANLTATVLARK
ncbi:MAG TPA: hypothetical protein VGR35_13645 [Tepidisphaeraceae bacterium]|nr:hypothetical protein [Tepidisphaeraceae bacterium]